MNRPVFLSYVAGPLTSASSLGMLRTFYDKIGELCRNKGVEAYLPHEYTDPTVTSDIASKEVYRTNVERVANSDLVIAYVGLPSHGVGIEIERACQNRVDVILLYERGTTVSRMVTGSPAIVEHVVFSDLPEALERLTSTLDRWIAEQSSAHSVDNR